jgi:hypothetical protein
MRDSAADILSVDRAALRERLARLRSELAPPFDFDELQRRGAAHSPAAPGARTRFSAPHAAGIAAALGLLLLGGALWQQVAPVAPSLAAAIDGDAAAVAQGSGPALVRVDARAAAGDLEDRIAWMDDLLSEWRVQGAPEQEGLAALERSRSQMLASLQKVRYAEQLMNR